MRRRPPWRKVSLTHGLRFSKLGVRQVTNNLSIYAGFIPDEVPFWSNFEFSDGNGQVNRTYARYTNYTGETAVSV